MHALSNKPLGQIPKPAPAVLVTGAAKRLGREIALHLAAHGYSVAIHYLHSAQDAAQTSQDCTAAARAAGHEHTVFCVLQADLADEAQTRALLPALIAQWGTVDAVVNSASLFSDDAVSTFSYAALNQHLASNTAAPIVLAQALHTHLQSRASESESEAGQEARGCVVNLLDQKLWNQNPDFLSYTLSKAALEAATTMLAMALAPRVRVLGVAPGLTLTSHLLDQAQFEKLHTLSPLGRSSLPQDIAAAVRFALESPAITGTSLLVDGGQHLMRFECDFSKML